jgi:uncharacterized protein
MKYVLLYEPPDDLAKARELFPAHAATWKKFQDRQQLLMIGPFTDPRHGAMGIFSSRAAAEAFVQEDPFVAQGVVKRWELREWREAIVAEGG